MYGGMNLKKKIIIITSVIIILILVICGAYMIDKNRMANNKPVIFSTWGYSYVPPINLPEKEIISAFTEKTRVIGKKAYTSKIMWI